MYCHALCISVFVQLSTCGKYSKFGLIFYCCFCCGPCLAYDPVGALFDEEESLSIDIRSSHAGRVIPLRITFPQKKGTLPVILFSHGLGVSRNGYKYVRTYWTGRWYATIFLQHPGSDESLLQGVSSRQAVRNLRDAANRKNMNLRVDDVMDVLDAMSVWASDEKSTFYGRLNRNRVGTAGHSMGAKTAQIMIGQGRWLSSTRKEKRIRAGVLMSPSSPSFQLFRVVMRMNSCCTMQRTLLFLTGRYGRTHHLIQNTIPLSKPLQQYFGTPICKAIKRP